MIKISKMGAQGDILFRRVVKIPSYALERPREGPLVVAHSETGHHHVIESLHASLFSVPDLLLSYLRFDGPFADVVHQRPFDTHETLRLLGNDNGEATNFEVRRQREHAPEGWRMVVD
jgi:hypothetical protein